MIHDSPAINAWRGCAPIRFLILHLASSSCRHVVHEPSYSSFRVGLPVTCGLWTKLYDGYLVHWRVFDVPRYQRRPGAKRDGSDEGTSRGQSYTQPRVVAKNPAWIAIGRVISQNARRSMNDIQGSRSFDRSPAQNSATTTPQVPTSSGPASRIRIWDEIGSISLEMSIRVVVSNYIAVYCRHESRSASCSAQFRAPTRQTSPGGLFVARKNRSSVRPKSDGDSSRLCDEGGRDGAYRAPRPASNDLVDLARIHIVDEPGHLGVSWSERRGADQLDIVTHALLEITEG
jgi:hypothetical protein